MAKGTGKRFYRPAHWTLAQILAHYSAVAPSGCRLWTASRNRGGYGQVKWGPGMRNVHRLAWESANGPIPDGMHVCHHCDVRHCIEITHLFLGTNLENISDMIAKGRQGRGETKPLSAKLTAKLAMEIFKATGTHQRIADQYAVSRSTVGLIKNKINWAHIHAP